MTSLTRWTIVFLMLAATGWLWYGGAIGVAAAVAALLVSLAILVWPGSAHRRRDSTLRYVEMGKRPLGLQ